jgi:hypothetical protein
VAQLFPAIHWHENRIFDSRGRVWGVYRLPQFPYEHRGQQEQWSVSERFERFLHMYSGQGMLLSLARQKSLRQLEQHMRSRSHSEEWQAHVDAAIEELALRQAYDREVYLVLPLRTSAAGFRIVTALSDSEHIKRSALQAAKQVLGWLAYLKDQTLCVGREIPESLIETAALADRQLLAKLNAAMGGSVQRASPADIEWLHRKPYFRGLEEPPSRMPDEPMTAISVRRSRKTKRPYISTMVDIASAYVKEDLFRLRIVHSNKRVSYQSVMALANFTDSIEDFGDEWLYYPLERLDFPIDACVHFEVTPGHLARGKVRRKKGAALDQWEEFEKDGELSLDLEDGLADAPILEQKLKRMPLVEFQAFLAVGADNEDTLIEREEILINAYDGYAKPVHPPGDAIALWRAFFPCTVGGVHESWNVPAEPRVLSCAAPLGTSALGDPEGMLLGHLLGSGKPVFMAPERPMTVLNHTGSIALVGTLGSGKSMTAKYIGDHILAMGGVGFVLDPKQDEYFSLYHKWQDEAYWVRYGSDSDAAFSPFRLAKTAHDCRAIAQSWLSILFNISSSREDKYGSIVIDAALHRMYQGDTWDMDTFIRCLKEQVNVSDDPEEQKIGKLFIRLLDQYRDDPVKSCVFGKDEVTRSIANARLVVQSLTGLDFPNESQTNPDKWRDSQRFSVSMLYLSTQIGIKKLMEEDINTIKFFLIDEAWMLRAIPEGRALINKVLLMGRAMNLILILGVQNTDVLLPKDENDDITANLGWMFFFKLESRVQVKHAVEILNLPEDEDWQKTFSAYEKGRGIVRDPLGRVGEIQIDILPESLKEVFSTTPGQARTRRQVALN